MAEISFAKEKRKLQAIKAKAHPKYSTNELVSLGEKRYQELKMQLEPAHKNEFVVIEVDSGDYFIDRDSTRALLKAQKQYPQTIFYLARIGYPAAFSMKGHTTLL